MNTPLVANGVCIRPFCESDVSLFVDAVRESLSTVGSWMPWCTAGYSEWDARSWFERCATNLRVAQAYDIGVFSPEGEVLLGGVSIHQLSVQHNVASIGYWVRQSRQGQGIATRAVQVLAGYGFTELKFTRLEIVAQVNNHASRRVAEKVGAKFECIAQNRLVVRGQPVAGAVYSLVPGRNGF